MMIVPTATERRIQQSRRARERGQVLVPLLEELLEHPLAVEDKADRLFMEDLFKKRARPREKGVFSPSMLAACTRQAYFAKTGVERRHAVSPQTNAYFFEGDWRHYKWQFALWKLHRAGKIVLIDVEVRVYHPDGDFAGTIDAIVIIDGEPYVVDFKGMHVREFQRFVRDGPDKKQRTQVVGYAMIVNLQGSPVSGVCTCLFIEESKAGPIQGGSPIALHEEKVDVQSNRFHVKRRLTTLREYVRDEEVPPPACQSTRWRDFQECPFNRFCLKEVREIQKRREGEARAKRKLRVARTRS
jgi:hypothetical protein